MLWNGFDVATIPASSSTANIVGFVDRYSDGLVAIQKMQRDATASDTRADDGMTLVSSGSGAGGNSVGGIASTPLWDD